MSIIGPQTHNTVTLICANCGFTFTFEIECGDRTCPQCNRKRKRRVLDSLYPVVKNMKDPHFLTLTLKRRLLRRENITRLRENFTKLRHRGIWAPVSGGFYNIELGSINDDDTCNMHMHVLYDGPDIAHSDIKKAWHDITGDSYIVYITKCWDRKGAMWYLSKHFCKLTAIYNDHQAFLINFCIRNTRMVQGFGSLKHLNIRHECECPECHAPNPFLSCYDPLFIDVECAFDGSEYDHLPAKAMP